MSSLDNYIIDNAIIAKSEELIRTWLKKYKLPVLFKIAYLPGERRIGIFIAIDLDRIKPTKAIDDTLAARLIGLAAASQIDPDLLRQARVYIISQAGVYDVPGIWLADNAKIQAYYFKTGEYAKMAIEHMRRLDFFVQGSSSTIATAHRKWIVQANYIAIKRTDGKEDAWFKLEKALEIFPQRIVDWQLYVQHHPSQEGRKLAHNFHLWAVEFFANKEGHNLIRWEQAPRIDTGPDHLDVILFTGDAAYGPA